MQGKYVKSNVKEQMAEKHLFAYSNIDEADGG